MMIRESEVLIRLLEEEQAFVYTVRRGGGEMESAVVPPAGPERGQCEPPVDWVAGLEFYGGSQAMD